MPYSNLETGPYRSCLTIANTIWYTKNPRKNVLQQNIIVVKLSKICSTPYLSKMILIFKILNGKINYLKFSTQNQKHVFAI
jgi:hypothetical protein